jgi:hypothetical protein
LPKQNLLLKIRIPHASKARRVGASTSQILSNYPLCGAQVHRKAIFKTEKIFAAAPQRPNSVYHKGIGLCNELPVHANELPRGRSPRYQSLSCFDWKAGGKPRQ